MWLKIVYNENDIANWHEKSEKISVFLEDSHSVIIPNTSKSFRVSTVFPLIPDNKKTTIDNCIILFFSFPNAYCVLGRVEKKGSKELKESTYFSLGLCSVILFLENEDLLIEFKQIIEQQEVASERWDLKGDKISKIVYELNANLEPIVHPDISADYSILNITERAIIDEFRICINLLMIKLNLHMSEERNKFKALVEAVDSMVKELVYLQSDGEIPATLSEYSKEELFNRKLKNSIWHQNLGRIIQINSALSYVSTQAFSGAVPILERRSLIRRNSLLGTGSTILALNRISGFIEKSFELIDFQDVITNKLSSTPPLKDSIPFPSYDCSDWSLGSLNTFSKNNTTEPSFGKLPYFSGRLGFRETEFSIAAALQSITSGASLEWSLMTLTHEMLHGHVRIIIDSIFYGSDNGKAEEEHAQFYRKFKDRIERRDTKEVQIDSIRNLILSYCTLTASHGSISNFPKDKWQGATIKLLPEETLWKTFAIENRDLSEIFVHILDLHYFYASRISIYIPLIWCSWLSVPHINGDLRQYILRSLLTIASTIKHPANERFQTSIRIFFDVMSKYNEKLESHIIKEVLDILQNDSLLMANYFPSFWISLCIVDLVTEVFYCPAIRTELFKDQFVSWASDEKDEDEVEQKFVYNLPNGFNDEIIEAPLSYLLDRMIKELDSMKDSDLERETAIQFLALNSKQ